MSDPPSIDDLRREFLCVQVARTLDELPALLLATRVRTRTSRRVAAERMGLSATTVYRIEMGGHFGTVAAIRALRWISTCS